MTLEGFIQSVKNLNAKDLIIRAASEVTEELADLNVIALEKGKLSTGGNIFPNYETEYGQFKKAIGSKSSPVPDLKVEGDFHEGIFAKISGGNIAVGSTDSKANKLGEKYGFDIYGVSTADLIETTDPIIVGLIDKDLTK